MASSAEAPADAAVDGPAAVALVLAAESEGDAAMLALYAQHKPALDALLRKEGGFSSFRHVAADAGEEQGHVPFKGLRNQGATCYMNSLLQTLYMTPPFRHAVQRFRYEAARDGPVDLCIAAALQANADHCLLPPAPYPLPTAHCALHTAHCALPTAHCALHCTLAVCSGQCAVGIGQCAVCSVRCAVCNVRCAVCSAVQCAVCSGHCAKCSALCSGQCAVCSLQSAQCALHTALHTLRTQSAHCALSLQSSHADAAASTPSPSLPYSTLPALP